MTDEEIIALMCEIPQLDKLNIDEMQVVAGLMEYKKVEENTMLVKEGGMGDSLFYIVEGQIEIKKENLESQQAILARFGKGAAVGEMALVEDHSIRSATATTLKETELLVLSRESFDTIVDNYPKIAIKVLKNIATMLSARLRYTSGRFADIC